MLFRLRSFQLFFCPKLEFILDLWNASAASSFSSSFSSVSFLMPMLDYNLRLKEFGWILYLTFFSLYHFVVWIWVHPNHHQPEAPWKHRVVLLFWVATISVLLIIIMKSKKKFRQFELSIKQKRVVVLFFFWPFAQLSFVFSLFDFDPSTFERWDGGTGDDGDDDGSAILKVKKKTKRKEAISSRWWWLSGWLIDIALIGRPSDALLTANLRPTYNSFGSFWMWRKMRMNDNFIDKKMTRQKNNPKKNRP